MTAIYRDAHACCEIEQSEGDGRSVSESRSEVEPLLCLTLCRLAPRAVSQFQNGVRCHGHIIRHVVRSAKIEYSLNQLDALRRGYTFSSTGERGEGRDDGGSEIEAFAPSC